MRHEDFETIEAAVEDRLEITFHYWDEANRALAFVARNFELHSDHVAIAVDARVRDRAQLRALQRAKAALAELRPTEAP